MGAALKSPLFISHSKDDFSCENFFRLLIFSIEMNVPFLAKILTHGRNFEKFCLLSYSKNDFTCQKLFKILVFSFEKVRFLSHSKNDCSFENLCKILVFSFEMNVPILAKMLAHGRSFENSLFYHTEKTILALKTFSKPWFLALK